jgi:hypothetical protein
MATGRVPTTANSPLTAKGDLFTYSTAPARLAVGNNGDTIVADSSTSTGLRYTGGNALGNPVINSAFQVWQRGTSIAIGAGVYTADRWFAYRAVTGSTVSRQATNDTTNLPFIQYCARVQRDSGNTSTSAIAVTNSFESINSIPYAGRTVTLSFYARAGANFSQASNTLTFALAAGTGTDQNLMFFYTGQTSVASTNAVLTTTWQRFTVSGTVPTNATEIGVRVGDWNPVGTAGAADFFEVTGVQIDLGSVALPFRTYAGTIQGELAACQRYYTTWNSPVGTTDAGIGTGFASSTTSARIYIPLPVRMRTTPTTLDWTASGLALNEITAGYAVSSLVFQGAVNNPQTVCVTATVASGLTQWRPYFFNVQSSTSFGIGAEL